MAQIQVNVYKETRRLRFSIMIGFARIVKYRDLGALESLNQIGEVTVPNPFLE